MEYRIDLFAFFIFLGIVQAMFLSFFFFSKKNRSRQYNIFFGWFLISIVACLLEIFFMYTGYVIHALHLVDFSETFALLIGPMLYLFVRALAQGNVENSKILIHILFPLVYTLLLIPFLLSSADFKYNSWIYAYHPNLPLRETIELSDPRWFLLTEWHTELVLISLTVYLMLCGIVIFQSFRKRKESFWSPQTAALRTIRNGVFHIALFTLLILLVKLFHKDDTGDHLFAAFGSLLIYITSFSVMRGSGFFRQTPVNEKEKYKSSTLPAEQQQLLLDRINRVFAEEMPFLNSNFTLPDLAAKIGSSVHITSQVINENLNQNFFEFLATHRILAAKEILVNEPYLKIEEVAERVGYNSKSSFNTAFKKIAGITPSEYRQKHATG